jgi:hypothetical protein
LPVSGRDVGVAEALLHIYVVVPHAATMGGVVLPDVPA